MLTILTKDQWNSLSFEEQEAYRRRLFVKRSKETNPWLLDGEPLEGEGMENYMKALLAYYHIVGLPHYTPTNEEKRKEFKKFLGFNHANVWNDGLVLTTMHALGLAWSYFPHMWGVRCNKMATPKEVFDDDAYFMKAIRKRMRLGTYINDGGIRKAIRSVSGVQSPSNFRPSAAAAIYHHFLPEGGVTWDMSSGFGGRLLGAMACSRVSKYIGTDPSSQTMASLRKMADELLPWLQEFKGRSLEVELYQRGSEDFEPLPETVDLCFTSPPYFDCEKYCDELTQSYLKFPSKEAWMNGYMRQTLANCRRALKPDGHLVVNIAPVKSYPDLDERFKYMAMGSGWGNMTEAKLKLFKMMGTRVTMKDGVPCREVFKTEPLLIFRKAEVRDILEGFQPAIPWRA